MTSVLKHLKFKSEHLDFQRTLGCIISGGMKVREDGVTGEISHTMVREGYLCADRSEWHKKPTHANLRGGRARGTGMADIEGPRHQALCLRNSEGPCERTL